MKTIHKRITIIGANSYLARNFIRYLEEVSDRKDTIKLYDWQDSHNDGYDNYYSIDLSSKEELSNIDMDVDLIYIFTGITGTKTGFTDYKMFIEVNEVYLLNILTEYVVKKSTAKIIYPSSRLVYKSSAEGVNEDSEKEFNSVYAITKFASENYLKMYNKVYGINYSIFRICVPFGTMLENCGSYGTFEFFTAQAKKDGVITVYGDGSLKRTFIHIKDICRILLNGGEHELCTNNIFNMGGYGMSLLDIAEIIADKYNAKIKLIDWPEMDNKLEVGDVVFDSKKLDAILNIRYKAINA